MLSMKNLRLKNKVFIAFALSSVLPLLLLFYVLLGLMSPEAEQFLLSEKLVNVDLLMVLAVLLSVLGVRINLDIIKGIGDLVKRSEDIYPDVDREPERKLDEIAQLADKLTSIMGKMQEQMSQLEQFEKDLANTRQELMASNARLKEVAIKDDLTGVYNRRLFNDRLQEEVKRAMRYKRPISLLMLDIDGFKEVNDDFGHMVGDVVLEKFARLLKSSCREVDVVARYGGDEFSIILPETDNQGAMLIAERISKKVEKQVFLKKDEGKTINLTISIGVSTCTRVMEETEDILHFADKALSLAKKEGKNSVIEYSPTDLRLPSS